MLHVKELDVVLQTRSFAVKLSWCLKADWSNAEWSKICMLTKLTWHFLCLLGVGYQSICNHLNNRPLKYSPPKPQHFMIPTGSTEIYLLHAYAAQPVALIHPTGSQLLGVWPSAALSEAQLRKFFTSVPGVQGQGGTNSWAKESTGLCWSKRALWQAVTVTRHGIVMKCEFRSGHFAVCKAYARTSDSALHLNSSVFKWSFMQTPKLCVFLIPLGENDIAQTHWSS